MKNILAIALASVVLLSSAAQAASLSSVKAAGSNTWSIYLQGSETNIVALGFSATPASGTTFANLSSSGATGGAPRPAGQAFTYRNALLEWDPTDSEVAGGLGYTLLNKTTTASGLTFEGGPLGGLITIPQGGLFLANLNFASGAATATVNLKDAAGGDIGQPLSITVGAIPEPATLVLAGISALGLAAARRRNG